MKFCLFNNSKYSRVCTFYILYIVGTLNNIQQQVLLLPKIR